MAAKAKGKKVNEDDLTEESALALIKKHKQALRLIGIATTLDYGECHADGDCLEGAEWAASQALDALNIKRAAEIAAEENEEDDE
jgi:hypothetical protein